MLRLTTIINPFFVFTTLCSNRLLGSGSLSAWPCIFFVTFIHDEGEEGRTAHAITSNLTFSSNCAIPPGWQPAKRHDWTLFGQSSSTPTQSLLYGYHGWPTTWSNLVSLRSDNASSSYLSPTNLLIIHSSICGSFTIVSTSSLGEQGFSLSSTREALSLHLVVQRIWFPCR